MSATRTDHSAAIATLREDASWLGAGSELRTRLEAAAALLEVHDATGISLEAFGPVGEFVNDCLRYVGEQPFTANNA